MKFERFSLGTLCEMKYGKMPPKEVLADDGFPVFTGYRIAGYAKDFLFEQPKVVVVARGVGGTGDVKLSPANAWITNLCIVLDLKENVDQKYLLYKLSNEPLRENLNTGAAQAQITIENLSRYKIAIPSLGIQTKIAAIISAYDDLIENNLKRITLLEESARLLYREWFVWLRFPGYEHTRIVDGVPEGWERSTLAEVCAPDNGIQTGPFGSQLHQADYTDEGVPVVMPKNIVGFRVTTEDISRIPESLADSLGRHRMKPGDVVYGRRGDIGRRGFITRRQTGWFCGTGCLRLRPDPDKIVPRYFFHALGSPETEGTIVARAKGSTMPNLSASVMASVPLLRPKRTFQEQFAEAVEPMFEMIENLTDQNQKLRVARDLLLPRLMNGEIEV